MLYSSPYTYVPGRKNDADYRYASDDIYRVIDADTQPQPYMFGLMVFVARLARARGEGGGGGGHRALLSSVWCFFFLHVGRCGHLNKRTSMTPWAPTYIDNLLRLVQRGVLSLAVCEYVRP